MELPPVPSERVAPYLPVQRGHVRYANRQVLDAILDVAEQGCQWRGLPARFGNWRTIPTRRHRWAQNGVLARVCEQLQRERSVRLKLEALALDSASVQAPPAGTGALQKTVPHPSAGPEAAGPPSCLRGPRRLAPPWRSRSRRAGPATRRKGASC